MLELKIPIPRGYANQVVDELVDSRLESVRNNPELKTTDRWDLSNIFYKARKRLDAEGYDVRPLNDLKTQKRNKLYRHVKEHCDALGIKRHQIGIFPADRATLAFQGRLFSVSFENYKALADLGTDIVCIEKEGTVEKLVPFTTGVGIALLQSQGFMAEYGEMLAKEAARKGAHVMMLTDFDASGIEIAFKLEGVTRLGVDLDTIDELNNNRGTNDEVLDPMKLKESSLTKKGEPSTHWASLNQLVIGYFPRMWTEHEEKYVTYLEQSHNGERYIGFIKDKRIELNSIEDEVGAQRFWNWLYSKIIETFPTRNYNRAITVPRYLFSPNMHKFQSVLKNLSVEILEQTVLETLGDLQYTEGLIDTDEKLEEIESNLTDVLVSNPEIKKIDLGIKRLIDEIIRGEQ